MGFSEGTVKEESSDPKLNTPGTASTSYRSQVLVSN